MNDFKDAFLMLEKAVLTVIKSLDNHRVGNEAEIDALQTAQKAARETFISSPYIKNEKAD